MRYTQPYTTIPCFCIKSQFQTVLFRECFPLHRQAERPTQPIASSRAGVCIYPPQPQPLPPNQEPILECTNTSTLNERIRYRGRGQRPNWVNAGVPWLECARHTSQRLWPFRDPYRDSASFQTRHGGAVMGDDIRQIHLQRLLIARSSYPNCHFDSKRALGCSQSVRRDRSPHRSRHHPQLPSPIL